MKGNQYTKGKHWKLSDEIKEKFRYNSKGEKSYLWKGENVGYSGLHYWVRRWKGKAKVCIKCGSTKKVEWANVDHKYRRVLDDYISLCKKCHKEYDKSLTNKRRQKGKGDGKGEGVRGSGSLGDHHRGLDFQGREVLKGGTR